VTTPSWHFIPLLNGTVLRTKPFRLFTISLRARKDVVFENVTYHRVAPPVALAHARKERFQTQSSSDGFLITNRERSFVDCLLFLE
jgi:hypothetical protein